MGSAMEKRGQDRDPRPLPVYTGARHAWLAFRTRLRDVLRWWTIHKRGTLRTRRFVLAGRSYRYLVHPYNHTWANERAVEVPIVADVLESAPGARVLELGYVLGHYMPIAHEVVDKYDRSFYRRLRRMDWMAFEPAGRYDLIVSISTVEHIGEDRNPPEPDAACRALARMRSLLAPGGRAIVTFPVGANAALDRCMRDGPSLFDRALCLRRMTAGNEWEEVDLPAALRCAYGYPFPDGNAIVIGYMTRGAE